MNIDSIKKYIKNRPKLECLYMAMQAIKDQNLASQMVGVKRNPNNLIVTHYGEEHSDKIIYYILFDENAKFNGFCSLFRQTLMHLAYAEELCLTPVVCYGPNSLYFDESINDCRNAFEYYFEPVSTIDSSEVLKSKNVVVSKGADAGAFGTTGAYSVPEEEIDFLSTVCRKYIRVNTNTREVFWHEMQSIITGGSTLGVHVRATDFNKGYNRHPVVVTPEEYLDKTKEVYRDFGYEKVFLATDDERIIDIFKKEFSDKLFYYTDIYRSRDGEAIHYGNNNVERQHHKYNLGLEIIKDFYTLGYCEGLIAGNSNVSMCSRIIKKSIDEKYRTIHIIDKGVNHNMHETRSKFNSMLKERK